MTIIKSTRYNTETLVIERGMTRNHRDDIFVASTADSQYASGYYKREDFIAALKGVGITSEDLREPTPEELREAEIAKLEALPNGTVVERNSSSSVDPRRFFKAGGKFTREDTGRSYPADVIAIIGDTFTIKYPKED